MLTVRRVSNVRCVLAAPCHIPLLSPRELHFLPCPSLNTQHTPASGPLHMQVSVPEMIFPSVSTWLPPLYAVVLCLNVILSETLPRLANQKHKPLLPTSVTLYPFPTLLLVITVITCLKSISVCLFVLGLPCLRI